MISVIMPIYNGERYIEKSISDILNQPYENIELILVNDGSTDSSSNICSKFKSIDQRVKLINKKNEGICSARNDGLKIAKGDYISFIDQDDIIDKNIYNILSCGACRKSDLVVSGKLMEVIDENGTVIGKSEFRYQDEVVNNTDKLLEKIFNVTNDGSLLHIWNCLYSKKIIDKYDLQFDSRFKFGLEDTLFNIVYSLHCKTIDYIDGIIYTYFNRKNISTSTKANIHYLDDFSNFCDVMFESIKKITNKNATVYATAYAYRLGYNLYNKCNSNLSTSKKKQLEEVFNSVYYNTGEKYISKNAVKSFATKMYINLINWSILKGQFKMANCIIKMKTRLKS